MVMLRESRAKYAYTCSNCGSTIRVGATYYRGESYPRGRGNPRSPVQQYCYRCIQGSDPGDGEAHRYHQLLFPMDDKPEVVGTLVEYVDISEHLIRLLRCDWSTVYQLGDDQFV
jgi:hypothetical protein